MHGCEGVLGHDDHGLPFRPSYVVLRFYVRLPMRAQEQDDEPAKTGDASLIEQIDDDMLRRTVEKYKSAGLSFEEVRAELRREWVAFKRGAVEPRLYDEARKLYYMGTDGEEIRVIISEKDMVSGYIRNGPEGVLKEIRKYEQVDKKGESEEKTQAIEVFRFHGQIGPVVRVDGEKIGIRYNFNGDEGTSTLEELRPVLKRHFSLTPGKMQTAMEVMAAYVISESQKEGLETVYRNLIHVVGSTVECDYDGDFDIPAILGAMVDFYPHSTHPDALLSSLSRNLLSPLHYELKKRVGIVTKIPFGLLQGTTGAGKTPISELIMARGYDQKREEWFFQYENVKTFFSLMKHLTTSNLPCLYSDVNGNWLFSNKDSFKSYSQSGNIASRGNSDQTLTEYVGYRTFDIDTNSTVRPDDDAALSGRFSSYLFTTDNKRKVDRARFLEFIRQVPVGFMFALFREVFAGRSIDDILNEVEGFEKASQWEDYGIGKLNALCGRYGIGKFIFSRRGGIETESNTENVAYAFIDQYLKDHEEVEDYNSQTDHAVFKRKNVPLFSDNQVKVLDERDRDTGENYYQILFQASAYETLVSRLNLQVPYRKAAELMANVIETDRIKVLFDGKPTAQWMKDDSRKVYGLKVIK